MQAELGYIYAVYEAGSFSKAAENLYITQPALSMSVKKIESPLGMPLFDRSAKPLQLTQVGKIYVAAIEKMITIEENSTAQIHDLHGLKTGSLCIGGSHYINAYILPQGNNLHDRALMIFEEAGIRPRVRLEILQGGFWSNSAAILRFTQ